MLIIDRELVRPEAVFLTAQQQTRALVTSAATFEFGFELKKYFRVRSFHSGQRRSDYNYSWRQ